ncbi:hypothetical protein [Clostridium tyrobutyricum]|uniref:hypothetical protein n=1 Tax=Clostridium tyrobutyricum TaxID=1519 RepID=UPI0011C75778|nr:hypothetical protein [Clostridium tyrobutyricum]
MKKVVVGIIAVIVLCGIGIYSYINITTKNNFKIKQLSWDGNGQLWTDNSKNNIYDIKFGNLNGSDTKEIISKKNAYKIKIKSNIEKGNLDLKIYNNSKVLFEKNGSINQTIKLGDSIKDLKIKITGKNAKGSIIIKFS